MALSLGVTLYTVLGIGGTIVRVLRIGPGDHVVLSVDGVLRSISAQERTQILPKVYCSIGISREYPASTRLSFEAPREIAITRLNS